MLRPETFTSLDYQETTYFKYLVAQRMKTWLLVILAFVAGLSTMTVAANMNGFLAYISYHLALPPPTYTVVSAYINLGNLTPGESGIASAIQGFSRFKNRFYLTGFCFLPCRIAFRLTPLTMTTLNLTPGRSP